MSKLDQRGVIHLLVPLILLLGIIGGVYLITAGPLKLFPKASVSGPIGGVTYVDAKIGCGNPQGLTPDQICQQKGFVGAVAVDYQTAAKGYWWRQCGGASVSNCDRLNCKVNELDCTNTAGYWGSQQPYPNEFLKDGTSSAVYKPADFDIQTCSGYSPGWTMRVACSLSGGIPGPTITPTPSPTLTPSPAPTIGYQRIFITSTTYNGNLGGLAGADAKCQERANATNLGGTWKAWLSDNNTSASSRLIHHNTPYRDVDGTILFNNWSELAYADNTPGSHVPMRLTESGTTKIGYIWTNTRSNGSIGSQDSSAYLGGHCFNWQSSTSSLVGWTGHNDYPDSRWTSITSHSCADLNSLYCIEQTSVYPTPSASPSPSPSPTPSPTPIACTVNDLRTAFFSRRGEPKYNPACDINNDGRISVTDYSALLRNLRR